jgi:hypothetical protein
MKEIYVTPDVRHVLGFFMDRNTVRVPPLSLRLFAGPCRLLSPAEARHLLEPVCASFHLDAKVSQVELTADFDLPLDALTQLASSLRVRWAKRIWDCGVFPKKTYYWGDETSRCESKLYFKEEERTSFIRLEHTFRRDFLRNKSVNYLQDLVRHDWARTGGRRADWVELHLAGLKRMKPEQIALWHRVFAEGLRTRLDTLPANTRRWVMEHLKPLSIQTNLEAAFARITTP